MLRGIALIFALMFLLLGILGFIPVLTYKRLLFNLFEVGAVLNIVYLLTGLIGLSASTSPSYARFYFKVVGIVYGLLAILGFALDGHLWSIQINLADSFFYLAVAVIALYFGFTSKLANK